MPNVSEVARRDRDGNCDHDTRLFCGDASWYDVGGKLLGAGRMCVSDIRLALDKVQRSNPSKVYVVVVNRRDDRIDNHDTEPEELLTPPAFVFGKTINYFVALPELRKSMKNRFEEQGFQFDVVTPDEVRTLLLH